MNITDLFFCYVFLIGILFCLLIQVSVNILAFNRIDIYTGDTHDQELFKPYEFESTLSSTQRYSTFPTENKLSQSLKFILILSDHSIGRVKRFYYSNHFAHTQAIPFTRDIKFHLARLPVSPVCVHTYVCDSIIIGINRIFKITQLTTTVVAAPRHDSLIIIVFSIIQFVRKICADHSDVYFVFRLSAYT